MSTIKQFKKEKKRPVSTLVSQLIAGLEKLKENNMFFFIMWTMLFLGLWGFFGNFWSAVIAFLFLMALLGPKNGNKSIKKGGTQR